MGKGREGKGEKKLLAKMVIVFFVGLSIFFCFVVWVSLVDSAVFLLFVVFVHPKYKDTTNE